MELRQEEEREARDRIRRLEEERLSAFAIEEPEAGSGSGSEGGGGSTPAKPAKSPEEQQLALRYHSLAGLKPGDTLVISRDNLPGALLFPALVDTPAGAGENTPEHAAQAPTGYPLPTPGESEVPVPAASNALPTPDTENAAAPGAGDGSANTSSNPPTTPASSSVPSLLQNHRYLVITSERLLVLDAQGGGMYVCVGAL